MTPVLLLAWSLAQAADAPPPSAWDRQQAAAAPQRASEAPAPSPDDDVSMLAQLARMVVSLGIVVGLVYVFGKLVLPRLTGLRALGVGKVVRVVERVPVDQHQALLVVEVTDGPRLLLGTGQQGLRLIANLSDQAPQVQRADRFTAAMSKVAADAVTETPGEAS